VRRSWKGLLVSLVVVAAGVPAAAALAGEEPPVTPMIVGGTNATETYSFMASMQNTNGGHFCGGTLIRPTWVLTAKHCMVGETPSGLQIRIGTTNRTSGGTVARVKRWVDHANADTSLVELTAPVSQVPARIASSAPTGAAVRLLGWGCTTQPNCGPAPTVLQQLDTTILSDAQCGTNQYLICINNKDGWRSACYGDSGGPALLGTSGNWQLVGDTHGGPSVCGTDVFSYAELPTIKSWIESLAGPETGGPGPSTNLALNKAATGSASCAAAETPAKAVNGSVGAGNGDKWCSAASGTKTLQVDLGASQNLKRLVVRHAGAGGEGASLNTKDFDLDVSADGSTWTTAAQVRGNTANTSEHAISATARWIRLSVLAGTQGTSNIARIYEFEAYA
jgi:hypothetical protein